MGHGTGQRERQISRRCAFSARPARRGIPIPGGGTSRGGRRPLADHQLLGRHRDSGGGMSACSRPLKPCAFTGPVPGMDADVVDEAGASVRGAGRRAGRAPAVGRHDARLLARPGALSRDLLEPHSRRLGPWRLGGRSTTTAQWFIRGRSDDTLKVAGKRVGPAEVESAATAHPAVQEAAAIGVPHQIKGEAIVVFVVPNRGSRSAMPSPKRCGRRSPTQLGAALRPERVHWVRDLPKTRNAKIMRRVIRGELLEPGARGSLGAGKSAERGGCAQCSLSGCWRRLLHASTGSA